MKVKELIECLQTLNQDYEINVFNDAEDMSKDIQTIEEYEASRTYVIFPEQE